MVLILQILLKKNKYEKNGKNISDLDQKIPDTSGLVKKNRL